MPSMRLRTDLVNYYMAEAADQVQHDFWRPPLAASKAAEAQRSTVCARCGTEFIVSSLYCHACGATRPDLNSTHPLEIPGLAELVSIAQRLELTTPALVAFLLGIVCMFGALAVSLFFSARTVLDWQAIQFWRIEWMVAAIAAFAAGCVLKK